jgi:hypothetical protein
MVMQVVNKDNIRRHLEGKVREFLDTGMNAQGEPYSNFQEAEQAFKDWLWGTTYPPEVTKNGNFRTGY